MEVQEAALYLLTAFENGTDEQKSKLMDIWMEGFAKAIDRFYSPSPEDHGEGEG